MAIADGGPTETQKLILDYLNKHGVESSLNDVVSKCAKVRSDDPWGFMIGEFKKLQTVVIEDIKARQIFDSSGIPTVEAELITNRGSFLASVPCARKTKGGYGDSALRDEENDYAGMGVNNAVSNIVKIIGPEFKGMEIKSYEDQAIIDDKLSSNKDKWGSNATLAVSMAFARASANHKNEPLFRYIAACASNVEMKMPVPFFNILAGGNNVDNKLSLQEIMILPTGAKNFQEAMKMGTEVYQQMKIELEKGYRQKRINLGPHGGLVVQTPEGSETGIGDALNLVRQTLEAVESIHSEYKDCIKIGINAAASEMYNPEAKNQYDLNFKESDPTKKTSDELLDLYERYASESDVLSIEDPFDHDHWEAWAKITKKLGANTQIIASDLVGGDSEMINKALKNDSANAITIKMGQFATVTDIINIVRAVKQKNWGVTCSLTSGDTDDSFISHLAVGLCTGQVALGAPRFENVSKYNELLRIEELLNSESSVNNYAGEKFRAPCHAF